MYPFFFASNVSLTFCQVFFFICSIFSSKFQVILTDQSTTCAKAPSLLRLSNKYRLWTIISITNINQLVLKKMTPRSFPYGHTIKFEPNLKLNLEIHISIASKLQKQIPRDSAQTAN